MEKKIRRGNQVIRMPKAREWVVVRSPRSLNANTTETAYATKKSKMLAQVDHTPRRRDLRI